ncbi:hypothetical protein KQI38_09380 [Tissierella carlieri]|uniref:hypothetical protein n=1 Tax=Tissierella carlieri TaxID=689904 RepID=UPI001C119404|nr:hypothetical protein [Tissierella carlieri]MBU5312238.1 hypothetical protein [Tissierella carlieri]
MEVTKYYCELCEREVEYKKWTEIVIAVRHYVPHRQDIESCSKKICIYCMKELELVEEVVYLEDRPLSVKKHLVDKNKFKNIIRNLISRRRERND